jgi:hypothetical protein
MSRASWKQLNTATIYLAAGDAAARLEGGNPAAKAEGVSFLGRKSMAAVFEVGSEA